MSSTQAGDKEQVGGLGEMSLMGLSSLQGKRIPCIGSECLQSPTAGHGMETEILSPCCSAVPGTCVCICEEFVLPLAMLCGQPPFTRACLAGTRLTSVIKITLIKLRESHTAGAERVWHEGAVLHEGRALYPGYF